MNRIKDRTIGGNIDPGVVSGFGKEWKKFDQIGSPGREQHDLFQRYFSQFPWNTLSQNAIGFDLGCGTGRWARLVAPRVAELHCIEPSNALEIAERNLSPFPNCRLHRVSVDNIPLSDGSADFGYALGVLHHLPDPEGGLIACVRKLKLGAPLLVYVYYAFDNRPWWFRCAWKCSDIVRLAIARLPFALRAAISDVIATALYWPLAKIALLLEQIGFNVSNLPLSSYRHRSFYIMRNDALDRFGTRIERRFTRSELEQMMQRSGLANIRFGEDWPYWCAVGFKERTANSRPQRNAPYATATEQP